MYMIAPVPERNSCHMTMSTFYAQEIVGPTDIKLSVIEETNVFTVTGPYQFVYRQNCWGIPETFQFSVWVPSDLVCGG